MSTTVATAAIWHDVECGGYGADLPLWEELAAAAGGPVLDLGCGTGRVALHLARHGHEVTGLDREPEFITELEKRAGELPVETLLADARDFVLSRPVALALAPMQFLQLLPTRAERIICLRQVAATLKVGGLFAAAIVERLPHSDGGLPPLPDVREIDGWTYSSLPIAARQVGGRIVLQRLRRAVSPEGESSEKSDEVHLAFLTAERLEDEAEEAGLLPGDRRHIPETEDHVGSTVVLLERPR